MNKYVSISLVIVFFGFLIIVYSVTKLFYPAGNTGEGSESSVKFEDFGNEKANDAMTEDSQMASGNAKSVVTISSESESYAVGDSVVVDVMIDTQSDLVATELIVTYDNSVLEFSKTEAGDFFTNPREVGPTVVDNGVKHMQLSLPSDGTSTGNGSLVTFYFTAIGQGSTTIDLSENSLVGAINADGENDLKSVTPLTVTVE